MTYKYWHDVFPFRDYLDQVLVEDYNVLEEKSDVLKVSQD